MRMQVYLIDYRRLVLEYEYNLKGKGKGTFNWFITPKGILNIYIDIYGTTLLYQQVVEQGNPDSIPATVHLMLDKNKSILGVYKEETGDKERRIEAQSLMPFGEEQ